MPERRRFSRPERRKARRAVLDGDQGYVSRGSHERTGHQLGSHRSGSRSLFDDVDIDAATLDDGDALIYDVTTETWQPGAPNVFVSRSGETSFFTDLVGVAPTNNWGTGWYTVTSGNVSSAGSGHSGHVGVVGMTTGASASGSSIINHGSPNAGNDQWYLGDGRSYIDVLLKTPTTLSNATDRYWLGVVLLGSRSDLNEEMTTAGLSSISVVYKDDVNAGKWMLRLRAGGTNTDVDTGIAVAADTWYRIEIEINAAGTAVTVWINTTKVVDATTTGVSTSTGPYTPYFGIRKTAGTSPRLLRADWAYLEKTFTIAR